MIIVQLDSTQLENLVQKSVRSVLSESKNFFNSNEQKPLNNADRLICKKEAANMLGCSVSTVDNLRRRGILTRVKVGGKSARFRMSEIQSIIENKKDSNHE